MFLQKSLNMGRVGVAIVDERWQIGERFQLWQKVIVPKAQIGQLGAAPPAGQFVNQRIHHTRHFPDHMVNVNIHCSLWKTRHAAHHPLCPKHLWSQILVSDWWNLSSSRFASDCSHLVPALAVKQFEDIVLLVLFTKYGKILVKIGAKSWWKSMQNLGENLCKILVKIYAKSWWKSVQNMGENLYKILVKIGAKYWWKVSSGKQWKAPPSDWSLGAGSSN